MEQVLRDMAHRKVLLCEISVSLNVVGVCEEETQAS